MRFMPVRSILSLLAAVFLLWTVLGGFLLVERRHVLDAAERDVGNLSLAFQEQSFWLLSTVEQALRAVRVAVEAGTPSVDLHQMLLRQQLPPELTLRIAVIDSTGYVVAATENPGPEARITSLIDEPYVVPHLDRDIGGILVAPPQRDRHTGQWLLPISMRLNRPDGGFAGVVLGTVNPLYLSAFYNQLDLGPDGTVTIVGTDGLIRARGSADRAAAAAALGRNIMGGPLLSRFREEPSGVFREHSRIDGVERVMGYRRIHDYPLIGMVGRSVPEVMAPWRHVLLWTVGGGLVATAAFCFFFWLLYKESGRRRVQARDIEEANRLLRLAEQVARVGHWRIDLRAGTVFWSDEIYRIHGLSKDSFTPGLENIDHLYHPEDRAELARLVAETRDSGEIYEAPLRLTRPDGEERIIVARGVVERAVDGAALALFGVISDVTERVRQEQALTQARQEAEAAARAKADFLATVSHELRTPLNAVIGFADLLLATDLPERERRHYIRLQAEAGRTLLAVINDVLDFSKIDAGRLELEEIATDIVGLLQTCADLVQAMAAEKGLALVVEIAPDLPPWLMLDPTRVRQVVLNLLNNAVKFTQAGQVRLRAVLTQNSGETWLHVGISDTGIGVAPERQATLFEPFHQADASTARRYGGTGLGLAICKRLIGLMGGRIGLDSAPGRGSLFWIEIPLRQTDAPTHAPALPTPGSGADAVASRPLSILVAEDLAVNQLLVRAVLERAGHRVEIAADGVEALSVVQRRSFDLVLMDVQMPGMDGLEATRAIRALPAAVGRIPIIALTANALESEVERCRKAGMNDHIAKPIEADHLLAVLARWSQRIGSAARGETPSPAVPPAVPAPGTAVLAEEMLAQLESLMGASALHTMLLEVSATLKTRLASILDPGATPETVRTGAHAMISLAGNFGLMEMSQAARSLELAYETAGSGSDDAALRVVRLAELNQAAGRAQAALVQWLPQLSERLEKA